MQSTVDVLFSDLDGTLVHYPKELNQYAQVIEQNEQTQIATIKYIGTGELRECAILSSMSGGPSYISLRTKHLIQQLRSLGVVFVIITGARTSTYQTRRPLLPPADFEFFENGGRKLFKGNLDPEWTDRFVDQIGIISDRTSFLPDIAPPEKRDGTLWSLHNLMVEDGWSVDARNYTTNFRVDVRKSKGKTEQQFKELVQRECVKRKLASSFNLGKADLYPDGSGKANAARHVLQVLNVEAQNAVAMFDDDNDLELGALCGRSFLPGVTHPSVLQALKENPSWTLTEQRGFLGTEAALEAIMEMRKEAMARQREPASASA